MAKVLALSALLALAAVNSVDTVGTFGLKKFCRKDLGSLMAENQKVYTDLQAALQQAKRVLGSSGNRKYLSEALTAVAEDQSCCKRSLQYVTTIAYCQPAQIEGMQKLLEAAQRYTQKCVARPAFWDAKLEWTLSRLSPGEGLLHEKITKALDHKFIADFTNRNAHPRGLSFREVDGQGCCQATQASKPLQSILDDLIGSPDYGANYEMKIEMELFHPCDRHNKHLAGLMTEAMYTADLHPGGESAFIQSQSEAFQDAIFRYRFCDSINKEPSVVSKIKILGLYDSV